MMEAMIRKQTAKQARQLEDWLAKHDAAHPFPANVELTADVAYAEDARPAHRMDIYRLRGSEGRRPVLVNFHGGGFLLGHKEANRLFCADLCQRGFLVFGVEYPLAPQASIFQILRDLTQAVEKAAELCPAYGGDPEQISLCGDSAGAYLCVYLAALQNSTALAKAAGVEPCRVPFRGLGLISGMFYTRKPDSIGIFLPAQIYGRGWRRHPFRPYMNPEHPEVIGHLPPTLLVTADGDFLRHYSRQYAAALQRAGRPYRLIDIQGTKKLPHAFAAMLPELPESKEANAAMAEFLRSADRA